MHQKQYFASSTAASPRPLWPVFPKKPAPIHCSHLRIFAVLPCLHNPNENLTLQLHTDFEFLLLVSHTVSVPVQALRVYTVHAAFGRKCESLYHAISWVFLTATHAFASLQALVTLPHELSWWWQWVHSKTEQLLCRQCSFSSVLPVYATMRRQKCPAWANTVMMDKDVSQIVKDPNLREKQQQQQQLIDYRNY